MKLTVIIPAYNEEHTILKAINQIICSKPFGLNKEIIVVNDASTDMTSELLKSVDYNIVSVINLDKNMGKANAVRKGLKSASGDFVIIQDADLELSPSDYPKLLEPLIEGKADIVYGSRFLNGWPEMPMYSKIANLLMTLSANVILGLKITDGTCGYKVTRFETLKKLILTSSNFSIEAEIISRAKSLELIHIEVPVSFKRRTYAQGKKIKPWDAVDWIFELIRNRFRGTK